MVFTIEMLPAKHGDALWIEYGNAEHPHRILIDGGPRSRTTYQAITSRIGSRMSPTDATFELIVVTHIDADHITGILKLTADPEITLRPGDIWFNGWDHLPTDRLGAKQAEALGAAINRRRLPWNGTFSGAAAMVPENGPLPTVELPGGMVLTVLGPTRDALADLRPVWQREVEKAGMVPGKAAEDAAAEAPDLLGDERIDPDVLAAEPYEEDHSEANGASIAVLAEFEDSSALLTGDAHGSSLVAGLTRLAAERGVERVPVDVFKLPHHGSKYNLSAEVLDLVECPRFLFSTNGNIFGHPDPVAVSRIITRDGEPHLEFNYRSDTTERWDSRRLRRRFGYTTVYPEDEGLSVDVAAGRRGSPTSLPR